MLTNQRLHAEASLMIAVKLRFLQSRRTLTEDKAGSWFESTLANPTRFAIAEADSGKFIGLCAIKQLLLGWQELTR